MKIRIVAITILMSTCISCSEAETNQGEDLFGIELEMEDGELCVPENPNYELLGNFEFQYIRMEETFEYQISLTDQQFLTSVDRRETKILKELESMGFEEIAESPGRCTTTPTPDMGADAR